MTATIHPDLWAEARLAAGLGAGDQELTSKISRVPTILLKDSLGRVIETDSSYQRTIMEARSQRMEDFPYLEPEEWRLPPSMVPSRPDYSRYPGGRPVLQDIVSRELTMATSHSANLPINMFREPTVSDRYKEEYKVVMRSLGNQTKLARQPLDEMTPRSFTDLDTRRRPIPQYQKVYLPFVNLARMCRPAPLAELEEYDVPKGPRAQPLHFPSYSTSIAEATELDTSRSGDSADEHSDKPVRIGGGYSYIRRGEHPSSYEDRRSEVSIPRSDRPTSPIVHRDDPIPLEIVQKGTFFHVASAQLNDSQSDDARSGEHTMVAQATHVIQQLKEEAKPVPKPIPSRSLPVITEKPKPPKPVQKPPPQPSSPPPTPPPPPPPTVVEKPKPKLIKQTPGSIREWPVAEPAPKSLDEDLHKILLISTDSTKFSYGNHHYLKIYQSSEQTFDESKPFEIQRSHRATTKAEDPFSKDRNINLNQKKFEVKKSDKELTNPQGLGNNRETLAKPKEFKVKKAAKPSKPLQRSPRRAKSEPKPRSPSPIGDDSEEQIPVAVDASPKSSSAAPTAPPTPSAPTAPAADGSLPSAEPFFSNIVNTNEQDQSPKPLLPALVQQPEVTQVPSSQMHKPTKQVKPARPVRQARPTQPIEKLTTPKETEPVFVKRDAKPKRTKKVKQQKRPKPVEIKEESEEEPEVVEEPPPPPTPSPSPIVVEEPIPEPAPIVMEMPALPELPPLPVEEVKKKEEVFQLPPIELPKPKSPLRVEAPPPFVPRRVPPATHLWVKSTPKRKPRKKMAAVVEPVPRDPLSYWARYCIIQNDRLPHYERVFKEAVKNRKKHWQESPVTPPPLTSASLGLLLTPHPAQTPLTPETPPTPLSPSSDPILMAIIKRDVIMLTQPSGHYSHTTKTEEYISQLQFKLNQLYAKRKKMWIQIMEFEDARNEVVLDVAKKEYRDEYNQARQAAARETEETPSPLEIVSKISSITMKKIATDYQIAQLHLSLKHANDKCEQLNQRVFRIEEDLKRMEAILNKEKVRSEQQDNFVDDFRRKQSARFNRLHPLPDFELSIEELEPALQVVNQNLITEKECEYIYHILELPGHHRINMQLFSLISALSERVVQSDSVIKKLINKYDFEALSVKMQRSKELFYLLDRMDENTPEGFVSADTLAIELAAGGLPRTKIAYAMSKLNRDGTGMVNFLDFLTYIPLFIEIHEKIVADPLNHNADFDLQPGDL